MLTSSILNRLFFEKNWKDFFIWTYLFLDNVEQSTWMTSVQHQKRANKTNKIDAMFTCIQLSKHNTSAAERVESGIEHRAPACRAAVSRSTNGNTNANKRVKSCKIKAFSVCLQWKTMKTMIERYFVVGGHCFGVGLIFFGWWHLDTK